MMYIKSEFISYSCSGKAPDIGKDPTTLTKDQTINVGTKDDALSAVKKVSCCIMLHIVAECRPTIKWLMARTLLDVHKHENLLHFPEGEEDNSDWWVIDKLKGSNSEESEEDDIEDW